MDPMLTQSAVEAAAMIRRGEVSSRELTSLVLNHIDAVNPSVNAVVETQRERASRAAAVADETLARAGDAGPLHGVPITVKESLHANGWHSTWGNPAFTDYVADTDATVVARLARAGAVQVGTTNVAFMLNDFGQSANDVYGVTNNPWDLTRAAGGSSGGAAAALAAGLSFLEYGTDLVGSIRIPAAFCGVYGLKPTAGIVPTTGLRPPGPPRAPLSEMTYTGVVGPLARSARDIRTALSVTAGPEGDAAGAYTWRLAPPRHQRLADYRVGVVLDHPRAPVSADVAAVLSSTVDGLAKAGCPIVEGWPEGVDPERDAETFGFQVGLFFAFQGIGGASPSLAEVIEHDGRRAAARAAWSRAFDDIDVFICPVNFTAAFPHDTRPFEQRTVATSAGDQPYGAQSFWVAHPSLVGLPALAAPVGLTAAGLPVGAQVIAARYEDDTAITFAELLAEVTGGYAPPPID